MLGYACSSHFLNNTKYETFVSLRSTYLARSFFVFDVDKPSTWDNIPECDYIINCIGLIKHDASATRERMFKVNSTFVSDLASWCSSNGTRLIHISTDSVFSGARGMYVESDIPDPVDDYGESKLAGEGSSFMCIRTSTIGEELRGKLCILEWLKDQSRKKNPVNGFINQFWNGLTAKEYARMCDRIITNDLYVEGIRHVYSNVMTKYELIVELDKKFKLNLKINPTFLDVKIDRTLISEYDTSRKLIIPTLKDMIGDL